MGFTYFKFLMMSKLLYLHHLCSKKRTNLRGDGVAGDRKNAGESLQPIRRKGKDLTNGSPPGHSLRNFYAGGREK